MAVAGGAVQSVLLELNGRHLTQGPIMHRQGSVELADEAGVKRLVADAPWYVARKLGDKWIVTMVIDTAPAAWAMLLRCGRCYMQMLGSNLADVRGLYGDWVEQVRTEDEDE